MPSFLKRPPVRSPSYRRWVASTACRNCGIEGYSQAAHPNQGRGLGQKTDDRLVFALCCTRPGILGCHAEHDQLRGMTLAGRRERENLYIMSQQMEALEAGRSELKEAA
tara:strand:+ start:507 stop:833 length:327 start_codon:yes stop_codon:yes gene_type:complete